MARALHRGVPIAASLARGRTREELLDRLLGAIQSVAPEWPSGRQSISWPKRERVSFRLRSDLLSRLDDNAAFRDCKRNAVLEKVVEIGLSALDAGFFPASCGLVCDPSDDEALP